MKVDVRYVAVGAGLALLALLPLAARHVGLGWEAGSIAGLLATVAMLALCALPVRPREATPAAPLTLARHRDLGFAVVVLSAAHVGILLAADHPVIEYLKPTMPYYQATGLLAFAMLLVLAATSTAGQRRRLWLSHRGFQAFHVVLSIAAVALVTAHVVVSARYVHGWTATSGYVAITIGALAMLLRARKGARGSTAAHGIVGRGAFGRHSRLVLGATLAASLLIAALLSADVDLGLRATAIARPRPLPMTFPHEKHTAVNCITCHHNYADKRGFAGCIACHRSASADIKIAIEPRFHDFCLGCHRDAGKPLKKHGPVAGCEACHQGAHPAVS